MNWGEGYNVDLPYTYGYYRELDPRWLEFSVIMRGVLPPSKIYSERLRYIEFGCGQGYHLCLTAACNPDIDFVGIDFNPQHIAHANRLKNLAGLKNVEFYEGNFVELGEGWPAELGKFHYAAAHGVLSWINRRVREGLYKCIEKAVLPGGLVYLSYNTLPGWLSNAPIQHLLRFWQKKEGLSSIKALEIGKKRLNELIKLNSGMINVLPMIRKTIESIQKLDESYLSGEYLNDNWLPFWFDEIWDELTPHKLLYAGGASSTDWIMTSILPVEWKNLYVLYTDPVERELMLDVLINQSFRRDVWVKGKTPLWKDEQKKLIQDLVFDLITNPYNDIDKLIFELRNNAFREENLPKFSSPFGEIKGRPDIYLPLYAELNKGPKNIYELSTTLSNFHSNKEKQIPAENYLPIVVESICFMISNNNVFFSTKADIETIRRFNDTILDQVMLGAPYRYLVSPKFPCIVASPMEDLMLLKILKDNKKIDTVSLSRQLLSELKRLGIVLRDNDGNPLTNEGDEHKKVMEATLNFLSNTLPSWKAWELLE